MRATKKDGTPIAIPILSEWLKAFPFPFVEAGELVAEAIDEATGVGFIETS